MRKPLPCYFWTPPRALRWDLAELGLWRNSCSPSASWRLSQCSWLCSCCPWNWTCRGKRSSRNRRLLRTKGWGQCGDYWWRKAHIPRQTTALGTSTVCLKYFRVSLYREKVWNHLINCQRDHVKTKIQTDTEALKMLRQTVENHDLEYSCPHPPSPSHCHAAVAIIPTRQALKQRFVAEELS